MYRVVWKKTINVQVITHRHVHQNDVFSFVAHTAAHIWPSTCSSTKELLNSWFWIKLGQRWSINTNSHWVIKCFLHPDLTGITEAVYELSEQDDTHHSTLQHIHGLFLSHCGHYQLRWRTRKWTSCLLLQLLAWFRQWTQWTLFTSCLSRKYSQQECHAVAWT